MFSFLFLLRSRIGGVFIAFTWYTFQNDEEWAKSLNARLADHAVGLNVMESN
jgi:hypothetical protein